MSIRAGGGVDSLSSTAGHDDEEDSDSKPSGINIPFQQILDDGQWLCSECGKDISTEAEALGCDHKGCSRWFHPSCVSDDANNNVAKDPWYCHHCNERQEEHCHSTAINTFIQTIMHKE